MTDPLEQEAEDIEMEAADKAYYAELGVSEWESCLTPEQTVRLIQLAELGFGTWGREPETLEIIKRNVK